MPETPDAFFGRKGEVLLRGRSFRGLEEHGSVVGPGVALVPFDDPFEDVCAGDVPGDFVAVRQHDPVVRIPLAQSSSDGFVERGAVAIEVSGFSASVADHISLVPPINLRRELGRLCLRH